MSLDLIQPNTWYKLIGLKQVIYSYNLTWFLTFTLYTPFNATFSWCVLTYWKFLGYIQFHTIFHKLLKWQVVISEKNQNWRVAPMVGSRDNNCPPITTCHFRKLWKESVIRYVSRNSFLSHKWKIPL